MLYHCHIKLAVLDVRALLVYRRGRRRSASVLLPGLRLQKAFKDSWQSLKAVGSTSYQPQRIFPPFFLFSFSSLLCVSVPELSALIQSQSWRSESAVIMDLSPPHPLCIFLSLSLPSFVFTPSFSFCPFSFFLSPPIFPPHGCFEAAG